MGSRRSRPARTPQPARTARAPVETRIGNEEVRPFAPTTSNPGRADPAPTEVAHRRSSSDFHPHEVPCVAPRHPIRPINGLEGTSLPLEGFPMANAECPNSMISPYNDVTVFRPGLPTVKATDIRCSFECEGTWSTSSLPGTHAHPPSTVCQPRPSTSQLAGDARARRSPASYTVQSRRRSPVVEARGPNSCRAERGRCRELPVAAGATQTKLGALSLFPARRRPRATLPPFGPGCGQ